MKHPKLRLTIPWESMELEAQQQIARVLAMPELECLAIMPDAHTGYDLCIGGVALLRDAISPSFVGNDIGCGMCHVNTGYTAKELSLQQHKDREKLFARLQGVIPVGRGTKAVSTSDFVFQSASGDKELDKKVESYVHEQLASLGSGNHFLEIGENAAGKIGVTIHSGSRRVGNDIASWYISKGRLFALNSHLGQAYLADMNWALDFALENRRLMLATTLEIMGLTHAVDTLLAPESMINETHNHAVAYGENLMLHRKGATPAEEGQLGVIPANQRDGVWITRGLGNKEFLSSASHGAGRKFSRRVAAKKGSTEELAKLMEGIVCRTDKGVLDEAPWAYKPIDDVLAAQKGILVDIVDHFKPIIVLKG